MPMLGQVKDQYFLYGQSKALKAGYMSKALQQIQHAFQLTSVVNIYQNE